MKESMDTLANDTRRGATTSYPGVYHDRGGLLSNILSETGLEDKLNPGELKRTWEDNANRMVAKTYKTKIEFPIFDIGLFNRNTAWWGVSGTPKLSSQKMQLDHYTTNANIREYRITGRVDSIINSDDALRPLPSSSERGFIFMRNPYPGYGYWKLYNDGYAGYNISYAPRPFVAFAFSFIFGNTANNLTSNPRKVKMSFEFKEHFSNVICNNINKKLGGK
jgi:hypothetical protein